MRRSGFPTDVMHQDSVAVLLDALLQIGGHAGTHGAKADKARLHRFRPRLNTPNLPEYAQPYGFASKISRAMLAADIEAGQPA